jgi:DNA-binding response OmpR family regulator
MADALRALVVEDDQSVRIFIEEALTDLGLQPSAASSGEEALCLLTETKYDLLVLDIKLGQDGFRGWHVARRARAIYPGLVVVYMTGAAAEEWGAEGVENSIVLKKPFAASQLVRAVQSLQSPT